jgi:asparagine synthase (glutamine-hydrolysing)
MRVDGLSSYDPVKKHLDHIDQLAPNSDFATSMSYLELKLRLPELLLMRVDKMTMGVGLEGRVPFLDHRFVSLAFSIPSALKTKNGALKYVLKKAVAGVIPENLIARRKQGFGVPVDELFQGSLQGVAEQELRRFCAETDLLDAGEVQRVMQEADGSKRWYLLNLALWWRSFIAGDLQLPATA